MRPGFGGSQSGLGALLDDCVHCGFCLPACPTYKLWGQEMDSPRGRIHIAGQMVHGEPATGAVLTHIDRCLSCMACVTACPSGVRYGEIIEAAREEVEQTGQRPLSERMARAVIFSLFPYPRRLRAGRAALGLAQAVGLRAAMRRPGLAARAPAFARRMEAMAPFVARGELRAARLPARLPGRGPKRGAVGLLTGCVQSVFFAHTNAATARVLAAEGFDVVVPRPQGCCGALSMHAGRRSEAARLARRTISCFMAAGVDAVVANAAGCGSAMKEYGRLLAEDPVHREQAEWFARHTRDFSELLASVAPQAARHALNLKVAYHDACHLAHAQGVTAAPRALLRGIPGLQVVEIGDPYCCGSAGIYNLVQPEAAERLGDRKAAAVRALGVDLVVTTNPGCLMQLERALERSGSPVRVVHVADVLDSCLRGRPVSPPPRA